jgi:hypothetical protein
MPDMSQAPSNTLFSDADFYRLLRGQIEFEDNLIVQRLNWFVASQSFLFTAYAITLGAPMQGAWPLFHEHSRVIFHLIPAVALALCALIYCAVIAGIMAQLRIHKSLHERIPCEQLAGLPPLQGAMETRVLGMAAPLGIPIVFAVVWTYLFVLGLR